MLMARSPISVKSDQPRRPGGWSCRKMTSRWAPFSARQVRMRRSSVRRIPAPISQWRRRISSKMATGRRPAVLLSNATTSLSQTAASGSGRRRSRGAFFCKGSRGSCSRRSAVATLNPALAAAMTGGSLWRKLMNNLGRPRPPANTPLAGPRRSPGSQPQSGYALLASRIRRHVLIPIDARLSPYLPRSTMLVRLGVGDTSVEQPGVQLLVARHPQPRRDEALAHQPDPGLRRGRLWISTPACAGAGSAPSPSRPPARRRSARPGSARTSAGSGG
jgi:hypothetical protein